MLTANQSVFLQRIFAAGLRVVIRRRFYGVFTRGIAALKSLDPARPLILCTNHTNWWDGFVAALLIPCLPGRRVVLAQLDTLLARYLPLRRLGVFGLGHGRAAIAGLRYSLRLLRDPHTAVWIFPQGVLIPQWQPIAVKPGALWLARRSGASVVPIVFRYEWLVESRPSIFINCGEPLPCDVTGPALTDAMQSLYDAIGPEIAPFHRSAFTPLFKPRMSMNKRWEKLGRAFRQTGGFNPGNE